MWNSCLCRLDCRLVFGDNESRWSLNRLLVQLIRPGSLQTARELDVSHRRSRLVDVPVVASSVNQGLVDVSYAWVDKIIVGPRVVVHLGTGVVRLTVRRPGNMARVARRRCSASEVVGVSSGVVRSWTGLLLSGFTASGWMNGNKITFSSTLVQVVVDSLWKGQ